MQATMNSNAVNAKPTPSSLSSSPPLRDLLAVDSVSDVTAFLLSECIADNPDARLQAFSEIVSHVSKRYTGDLSKATSFDSATTRCSQESGSPLDASRWKWADVLMRGVTDPWSRIRVICLSPMADLILSEVHEASSQLELAKSEQSPVVVSECARSSHSADVPSRRHSTGKLDQKRRASETTGKEWQRSLTNCKKHAPPPLAPLSTFSASTPLDYLWHYWEKTTRWYEHDGIVRLLVKVYGRSRTIPGAALRSDESGLRTLLFKVLFPAFRDPQLPVRESAAALLGVLVDRDRASPISPAIVSFIVDHVSSTLARVSVPTCSRSPLSPSDQGNTRVLEGNLLALVVLVDMSVIQVADSSMMPLLLRLASYPASSVRQYIAQILRPPSPPVFVYLMEYLCKFDGLKPHRSEADDESEEGDEDAGDGELNWQRQETVLMALQQHFLNVAAIRATTQDWVYASAYSEHVLALLRSATPLLVVFRAMHSPRFEVARMGTQLFPLLLQSCIRFLPLEDLPRICEACCVADGCMQKELSALQAQGDAEALSKAQLSMATLVMPGLWFYLAVRRIEMELTGGPRGEVERLIRPYATLGCVAFASQAHRSRDDADNASTTTTTAPCVASTCALLVLTAYFARAMEPAEWHCCVEEVLKPSWWADLLSNPVRREQVRFGPDFVRAVHHCGTPAQSQRIVELIPTLAAALADAQTHQQCLIISMIRVAVSAQACINAPMDERAMAYVYHDVYAAPALTEGGEATPLGHTWLKLFAPTQDAIPTTVFWGSPEKETTSGEARIVIHRDSDVFRAIDAVCLKDLFQSTKTEHSVLRELRSLMTSLARLSAHRRNCSNVGGKSGDDSSDVDWYALSLKSIFGRLDRVCPRWRERAAAEDDDGDTAANGEAAGVEEEDDDDVCWDDWDDDDDDADGCAQGIYEAAAIKNAVSMVTTLSEWVAANSHDSGRNVNATNARFHKEFKALGIK